MKCNITLKTKVLTLIFFVKFDSKTLFSTYNTCMDQGIFARGRGRGVLEIFKERRVWTPTLLFSMQLCFFLIINNQISTHCTTCNRVPIFMKTSFITKNKKNNCCYCVRIEKKNASILSNDTFVESFIRFKTSRTSNLHCVFVRVFFFKNIQKKISKSKLIL